MINLVLSSWLLLPTGEQDDKSRFRTAMGAPPVSCTDIV
jgi:hypothetical protein